MKFGNKFSLRLVVVLLCLMAFVMASCGGGNGNTPGTGQKAGDDKQVFNYPVVGDVKTVDPALVQDTDSNFAISAVFTGLVTLDGDLKVQPELASALPEVSDNGTTYTFKLRSGLKFSNGDPVTSKDVVYSINRAIDPATKSTVSGYLSLVKGFSDFQDGKVKTLIDSSLLTPDDQTVVIKLSAPAAYFLQTLAYPTSFVVNKKVVEGSPAPWTDHLDGAGTGPFKVASYSHTKGFELVPNENYYLAKPQLKKLVVKFYQDQNGMYRAYGSKQLDFTYVPSANLATEKNKPGYEDQDRLTIRYIAMNYKAKPFNNQKIRQALALAIDKDLVVKTSLLGAFTATNHLVPNGMPGYYADLKGPAGVASTKGDPTKAKQLLDEGLKEEGLSAMPTINFTFYPRNQNFKNALDQIGGMWKDNLGVTVKIETVTRPKMLDLQTATKGNEGPLSIYQAGWNADYPDPQNWLSTFFAKGSDYNQFNFGQNESKQATEQQAIQKLLTEADVNLDATGRLKQYNEAEQKIVDQVGWIPLWQERTQVLINPKVKGLKINAQNQTAPADWSKVYITQ